MTDVTRQTSLYASNFLGYLYKGIRQMLFCSARMRRGQCVYVQEAKEVFNSSLVIPISLMVKQTTLLTSWPFSRCDKVQ